MTPALAIAAGAGRAVRGWLPPLLLAVGCAGPAPSGASPPPAARVPVRIEFEPALRSPGELRYTHECGEQGTVPTACSAVELTLPAGPAALVLLADGRRHELVLRVGGAPQTVVWQLAGDGAR